MNKITFFLALLTVSVCFGQTNPINFEPSGNGNSWTFTVFENNDNPPLSIIPNPSIDAVNSSSTVAQFTARDSATGAAPFAGCITNDQGTFTLDTSNSTIKIKVWKSVISDVGIKFETGSQASTGEIKVPNTLINQWEELTFDFSSKIGEPTSTNITGLIIFPDFNTRSQDNIIYFDDITFSPQIVIPPTSTVVNFDANAPWSGFMNVFNLPENGGVYQFGSAWGVTDLKTVINTSIGNMTLQPNFNTYADNPTDAYWVNQTTQLGNKDMEASTNIQDNSLVGTIFTYTGNVLSNTLDTTYNAFAFIRVFDGSFNLLEEITGSLVAGNDFAVTYNNTQPGAVNIQYGFTIRGRNANPANETALGNIVIGPASLSTTEFSPLEYSIYPNPTHSNWTLKSNDKITSLSIYDLSGKQIYNTQPNTAQLSIDGSQYSHGVYFLNITTKKGSKTLKIIKN